MEAINVSINVTVDFSEGTKAFIAQLLTSSKPAVPAAPATPAASAAPAKPATPAAPATPAKPVAPAAPAKPAAPATPAKPATESGVTIEQVRQVLAQKVNKHREEIKSKLNELGSPSVTKLDPTKYGEMLSFLNSLD